MKKYILLIIIVFILSGCGASPSRNFELKTNVLKIQEKSAQIVENKTEFRKYLPILMFHYIEEISSKSADQMRYRLSFPPEKLEQFLIFFKEHHVETLTFWDLKDAIEGKKQLPQKSVILTFDDGYLDHYKNAFQMLKKYNMKGVFFIISKKPGLDANYATWEQLKEMAENGQEIASHTVSHLDLTTLSDKRIIYELATSKKTIEEKIGKPVITLCYPAGKYDDRAIKIASDNYLFARTTKWGQYFSLDKKYEIPTIRIAPTTNMGLLRSLYKK